ncbi:FAD binding domain protein [Mytilinidion resinicola]|uniref:FAD binding domain protein n=1 Tax=Mytilinidion resinicola TaxID=574789 RepID=A0A6A6YS68_9PEZI|nr:FAD binding domain protein [Mytilinidion resinicola]KAF2811772.1 FAD binding domain protein [Mytilinidion resinicola]
MVIMEETLDHIFKVIVVGGGIAGVTLANCLQKAGIDYVVLEARDKIAPQIGASVCLGPSALRIMDQLSLCDQILEHYEPINTQNHWKDGKCFASDDSYKLSKARWGYDVCCFDRQILLQILYGGLEDRSKVRTGKRVVQIHHDESDGVKVFCDDGSVVSGDVVVGADGVHSIVRQEMWRYANSFKPGTISQEEQNSIKAEYNCLFGISKGVKGVTPGTFHRIYAEGSSGILLAGKDDKVHWFFFTKLDSTYHAPNIPKYTKEDTKRHVAKHANWRYTDGIVLADLWDKRTSYSLACVEEYFLEHWSWGRLICIGDSVHKATPNAGLGGSQAIESCVALVNVLQQMIGRLVHKERTRSFESIPRRPTFIDLEPSLTIVQNKRRARAAAATTASNALTKLEALQDFKAKLLMLNILPNSGDFLLNRISFSTVGAEKLETVPDPERSYSGFANFNQNYGVGKEQSRQQRAIIAFPLLLLGFACLYLFNVIQAGSTFKAQHPLKGNYLEFASSSVAFSKSYCGPFTSCDNFLKFFVSTFSPSLLGIDKISYYQSLAFLTDAMPIFLIWVLESYRRANALACARFPVIFAILAQLYGLGATGPVYFFLHYVQSPLEQFIAKDSRMINVAYASTALASLIAAYGIPQYLQYFASSWALRLQANSIWQIFPLVLAVTHWETMALCIEDTTKVARYTNPKADLKHVRWAILTCSTIAAVIFNYVRFTSGYGARDLFVPSSAFLAQPLTYMATASYVEGWRLFLQLDEVFAFASAFAWLGLLFRDLKEAEMLHWDWLRLGLAMLLVTFVAGPGAAVGLLWLLREETLAAGHMKGAVVKPKVNGGSFL